MIEFPLDGDIPKIDLPGRPMAVADWVGIHVSGPGLLVPRSLVPTVRSPRDPRLDAVLAGMTRVVAGALAATARKRPGRHPKAGHVYLWGTGVVFATATVMAVIRWHEDWHLIVIATVAFGLAMFGWRARRLHRPGWPRWHATGMGGSYIALLFGLYVDNKPQLPHWTYWVIPTAIGVPLIWWALRRFHSGVSARPRAAGRSAVPPTPLR